MYTKHRNGCWNPWMREVSLTNGASQISAFDRAHNRWLSLGLSSRRPRRTKSLLGSSGPYGREDPILFQCIQSQSLILEEQVIRFQTPIAFLFSISACSLTFSSNQFSLHVSHITFVSYSASNVSSSNWILSQSLPRPPFYTQADWEGCHGSWHSCSRHCGSSNHPRLSQSVVVMEKWWCQRGSCCFWLCSVCFLLQFNWRF